MKKALLDLYDIELISLIKKSDKAYIIETKYDKYVLKYLSSSLENIFVRLNLANSTYFSLPIKSKNKKYVDYYLNQYFAIFPYFEDEQIYSKDVRLSIYIKAIAELHNNSSYPIRIQDGYFKESLTYIDDTISKIEEELLTRIKRIEKEEYHSPSDWYFLENYIHFKNALKEASIHMDKLEEEYKKEDNLTLTLTYQNFDFSHILIKSSKIISLDKMVLAPSIIDLYDLFINFNSEALTLVPYFKEYIEIHPLKQFELEWLFSLLFIPHFDRKNNELDEIKSLMNTLKYIKIAEEIASAIYLKKED